MEGCGVLNNISLGIISACIRASNEGGKWKAEIAIYSQKIVSLT